MADTYGDCRTEEGITTGLIDAIITAARVLARRDLAPLAVREALADLRADEDMASILAGETPPAHHACCPHCTDRTGSCVRCGVRDAVGEDGYALCEECDVEVTAEVAVASAALRGDQP